MRHNCCRFHFKCLCAQTPDNSNVQFDYGEQEYLLKYRLAVGIMMPSAPDFYRPSVSEHSLIAVINSESQKACENSPPF